MGVSCVPNAGFAAGEARPHGPDRPAFASSALGEVEFLRDVGGRGPAGSIFCYRGRTCVREAYVCSPFFTASKQIELPAALCRCKKYLSG